MKTICKASFFHLICIFFFFRIMERIAKNTKPTIQALGRACKKYPKTLPLFISILKNLYISKNISSSPNSDLPVSFTAAKSIISCVSIQSNKKMDRRKSVMEFSEHWQDLLTEGGFGWWRLTPPGSLRRRLRGGTRALRRCAATPHPPPTGAPVSLRVGRSADLTGHRPVIQHRGPPRGKANGGHMRS